MDLTALAAFGDILPEVALLLGSVVVLLFAVLTPRRYQSWAGGLAAATVLVAIGLTTRRLVAGEVRFLFEGSYAIDRLTDWGALLVLVTTLAVIGLSDRWFRTDDRQGEYHLLLLLSSLGVVLLIGATDLIQLVLSLLLSAVTGYVLSAFHRGSPLATEAGMKYFLLGAVANTSLLLGIAVLFGVTAATSYPMLAAGLQPNGPLIVVGVALVVLALIFKLGAFPLHSWVPDVARGAPAPTAVFITTAPKVGGLIALARFVTVVPEEVVDWRLVIAVLSAVTMLVGNLSALWQEDLRRMLGWSSVAHAGNGTMAIVALGLSDLAVPSLLYFLAAYVFGGVGSFGVVVALRGRTAREDYRGLARRRPVLAGALTVSLLSLLGVPPLAGFGAKLFVFTAATEAGFGWLTVLAVVNTVISVYYYTRFITPLYADEVASVTFPLIGPHARVIPVVAAVSLVVIAVFAGPLLGWFDGVVLAGTTP